MGHRVHVARKISLTYVRDKQFNFRNKFLKFTSKLPKT